MKSYGVKEPDESEQIGRADYPIEGLLNLLAAIIRDGLLSDPYWFMSPRARHLCDIGNLKNIKLMYKTSLDKNPHKERVPYQALSEDEYLDFRRAQKKVERDIAMQSRPKETEHEIKNSTDKEIATPRKRRRYRNKL